MSRRRMVYRASEYGRCNGCGKLTLKAELKPGPHGGMLGPKCMEKALRLPPLV